MVSDVYNVHVAERSDRSSVLTDELVDKINEKIGEHHHDNY